MSIVIHKSGQGRIDPACGGSYDGGERNDNVELGKKFIDQLQITDIAFYKIEIGVPTAVQERVLVKEQVVKNCDFVTFV
tara:strand:- start:269 stop:505 length:237 start_codon:yes stop_codon:yes gene_type:complete